MDVLADRYVPKHVYPSYLFLMTKVLCFSRHYALTYMTFHTLGLKSYMCINHLNYGRVPRLPIYHKFA